VQTTEKYLGCKQYLSQAIDDRIGIEPSPERRREGLVIQITDKLDHFVIEESPLE